MTIQWFPGHMLETKKLLKASVSKVDAVLEVLDARLPQGSANPLVNSLCRDRAWIKVLNKSDLADPEITALWLDYFNTRSNTRALAVCGSQKKDTAKALNTCVSQIKRNKARKIKVMVVGIPNTGKSTILNTLAGKKIAKTGNVPAVTRHQQRTSLKNNIDIYDTPGILWPVIEPRERALSLAASGAIADTALDHYEVALFAADFLMAHYPDRLLERYSFLTKIPDEAGDLVEAIGASSGCLKKGGIVNIQKASQLLIQDLRSGKIGRISFETPDLDEMENENEIKSYTP
ncbi:ribosome biogenesis GTPase YlqF [Desulfospira joergensenii]|uniref:ribosome biogenesis GTPase YlqF n=1 Tax=Desulfospira joergensenii TaxID=53329 RepID=UPI0003B5C52A|nr:ribosome biogenesis GTPase YlqF [Desulfospira joergensenii]